MDEQPKASKEHFHMGHVGIIALTAAALIVFTMVKDGPGVFAKSQSSAPAAQDLTYDQAKAQADAEADAAFPPVQDDTADQVAMLDPTTDAGSVLGTSTDPSEDLFPPADSIITPQMLDQLKVIDAPTDDATSVQAYIDQLTYVESNYNAVGILSDLNSSDANDLQNASDGAKKIVAALAQVPVPKSLEEFAKLKMIYYTTLSFMADSLAGKPNSQSIDSLTSVFFSLTEKLDSLSADISSQYGVQL